jgi:hypothetical protein
VTVYSVVAEGAFTENTAKFGGGEKMVAGDVFDSRVSESFGILDPCFPVLFADGILAGGSIMAASGSLLGVGATGTDDSEVDTGVIGGGPSGVARAAKSSPGNTQRFKSAS